MKTKLLAWTSIAAAGVMLMASGQSTIAQTAPAQPAATAADPNTPPPIPGQNLNGMHVYIRAGLKTHGPGYHDYPQFLADFSKILTEHGAVVDGSFHAPTRQELAKTDVILLLKGDAGYMNTAEKADLEAFVKRGGGIVVIHDSLCGPDPAYMAGLVGAGKKHGETNFTNEAKVAYTIVDTANPIMQGMSNFTLEDESFYSMTFAKNPGIHVLATTVTDTTPASVRTGHAGEVVPQIWTYEHTMNGGQPARSFVWMQGHTYTNMSHPQVLPMLLRGIAWAGKHPVNELVDYKPPARPARPARAPAAG